METVTIPKNKYRRLKRQSIACVKITRHSDRYRHDYPYDYAYIDKLAKKALKEHRLGKTIRATSARAALRKLT